MHCTLLSLTEYCTYVCICVHVNLPRSNVGKEVKGTISKLMLELECGGNVRLEEGQSGDIWYNSCAELVQVGAAPSQSYYYIDLQLAN